MTSIFRFSAGALAALIFLPCTSMSEEGEIFKAKTMVQMTDAERLIPTAKMDTLANKVGQKGGHF
ncbi:hypothetical protein KR767_03665 [Luteibacter anthropi]|uniref:hypothetical protein n=1 Tax=Luteibacter anthropi TaxID=564369 RepID=UPI002032D05D|nr:hypothetical protein [Luteibacter anthropi]URX63181.1 hypothetical protein KR767_03665 [Luteibacter anthropi]